MVERVERREGVKGSFARSGDETVLRGLGGAQASSDAIEAVWRGERALRGVAGGVVSGMGERASVRAATGSQQGAAR